MKASRRIHMVGDGSSFMSDGAGAVVPMLAMVACTLVSVLSLAGCGSSGKDGLRDLDPRGTSLLGEAQQAYHRGAYATTLQLVDSAETYVPEFPDLWFLRGLVLADLYRFDESDAAFERVILLDPGYRSARFNLGHNYFHQSSYFAKDGYREALRYYRAEETLLRNALSGNPVRMEDSEALAAVYLQIGTTYENLNIPDSARMAYRRALDADSSSARAYAWLAGAQQKAGDLENALANARRALDIQPNNVEYQLLLGVLLSEMGRHDAAIPYLAEASRREPWNRTAIYNLGQSLIAEGRSEEGEGYLARADSLEILRSEIERSHVHVFQDPDDPVRWENYAFLLQRAGRVAEAQEAIGVLRFLALSDTTSR